MATLAESLDLYNIKKNINFFAHKMVGYRKTVPSCQGESMMGLKN